MSFHNSRKIHLVTTSLCLSFVLTTAAYADNPLDYPPFKWYPLLPEAKSDKQVQSKSVKQTNGPQTNIMQNKNKSKQWYEGDFMGMDDD